MLVLVLALASAQLATPLSDLTPADSGGPLGPLFKAQGEHHAERVSWAAFVRDSEFGGGVLETPSACLSVLSASKSPPQRRRRSQDPST